MGRCRKKHDIRLSDKRRKITHRAYRHKNHDRKQLIDNSRFIKNLQKARLPASHRDNGKMPRYICQYTAHSHRKEKHRLIILFHSEPDQNPADGEHSPDSGIRHLHNSCKKFLKNCFRACHKSLPANKQPYKKRTRKIPGPILFPAPVPYAENIFT